MKKKYLFLLFCVLVFFNSCSVLSKSQIKNIHAFATSAENYTAFPSEIIKQRAELALQERLLRIVRFSPDNLKIAAEKAQKNYESQLLFAEKMDISLQLIQQYSRLLIKLSSDNFVENLSKNTDELNDNLGNLVKIANTKLTTQIPPNVGNLITKTIFLVGERLTKNKQAKALKEFVPIGNTLIKITVDNIIDALANDLPVALTHERQQFDSTYTKMVFVHEDNQKIVDYNDVKQYLIGISNYDNVEELRKQSIKATRKLLTAHSKLAVNIQAKTDITEIFEEIQEFIVSIQDLYKTFQKLSPGKQS